MLDNQLRNMLRNSTLKQIISESIAHKMTDREINDIVAYYEQMSRAFQKATEEVKEGRQPPLVFRANDED
jgi:cytochrome c553